MLNTIFNVIMNIVFIGIFLIGCIDICTGVIRKIRLGKQEKQLEKLMETVPEVDTTQTVNGYDVDAFRKRMEDFKKEYYEGVPLYDVPVFEPKKGDDFTGVEIITDDYETFMERKMK